jgi:glycerol-3-phosphate dehydrogenase
VPPENGAQMDGPERFQKALAEVALVNRLAATADVAKATAANLAVVFKVSSSPLDAFCRNW